MFRYGDWEVGYADENKWPNKRQFGYYSFYYDGHHKGFHLWRFYIAVYY